MHWYATTSWLTTRDASTEGHVLAAATAALPRHQGIDALTYVRTSPEGVWTAGFAVEADTIPEAVAQALAATRDATTAIGIAAPEITAVEILGEAHWSSWGPKP